jgi:hypothetical protein
VRAVLAQVAEREGNAQDFHRLLAERKAIHDADADAEQAALLSGEDFEPRLLDHDAELDRVARADEAHAARVDALMGELDDLLAEHRADAVLAVGKAAAKRRDAAAKRLAEAADALEAASELQAVASWLGAVDPGDDERARVLRGILGELTDDE